MNKKGVLDNLGTIVSGLGALAILGAIIFLIIAETNNVVVDQRPCAGANLYNATSGNCVNSTTAGEAFHRTSFSAAYNATTQTQDAASEIPGWLPIIVITVIGGLLLTLIRFFKK